MQAQSNAETVRRFFEAVYAGDYERAFSDYAHADYRFIVGSAGNSDLQAAIPWAGHVHAGQSGYTELTRQLFLEFEPLSFETRSYVESGDKVFVEGHFRFRHRITGQIADSDWLTRFDIKDGRIAGGQFYENTYAVAMARS
jgi:ketosteroid isomerase-like protein